MLVPLFNRVIAAPADMMACERSTHHVAFVEIPAFPLSAASGVHALRSIVEEKMELCQAKEERDASPSTESGFALKF